MPKRGGAYTLKPKKNREREGEKRKEMGKQRHIKSGGGGKGKEINIICEHKDLSKNLHAQKMGLGEKAGSKGDNGPNAKEAKPSQ